MTKNKAKILLSVIVLILSYFIGKGVLPDEHVIPSYMFGLIVTIFSTFGLFAIGYIVYWVFRK